MIKNTKQILTRGFSSEVGAGVQYDPTKVVKRVLKMNDGHEIPQVGFGTYSIKKPEQFGWALKYGYRHFDTGLFYMNEEIIAKEIKRAESENGIQRSQVFVASKIPPKEQGYEKTKAAVEKSLKNLSALEYIDLMLLTFPGTAGVDPKDAKNVENRHDSWRALEEFVLSGKIKSIGVANFKPRHL
jgi:diketogulonate reductase-like aldo/keto reductase